VTSVPHVEPPPRGNPGRRLSSFFHRHDRIRLGALLAAPVFWLGVVYIGSLVLLLMAAFWDTEPFTNDIVRRWNFDSFRELFDQSVYRDIAWRTIKMAALVTVADAVLAFPIAYYMARVASPRTRNLLVVAVLTPLWASYLVKAFAWRTMLGEQGFINWLLDPFGIQGGSWTAGSGWYEWNVELWLTFTYFWLPFMILPIYAGLERIPASLLEASGDLGARSARTFRSVILPLAFPAVVAGSIFTFSLTLGDFILPTFISGDQFMGTVIYERRSSALPFAAAFTLVPIAVMTLYLVVARKLGAFRAL
jgi:putative spermidine/putrescine transport system permease protein